MNHDVINMYYWKVYCGIDYDVGLKPILNNKNCMSIVLMGIMSGKFIKLSNDH